jgi:hypothetical protein
MLPLHRHLLLHPRIHPSSPSEKGAATGRRLDFRCTLIPFASSSAFGDVFPDFLNCAAPYIGREPHFWHEGAICGSQDKEEIVTRNVGLLMVTNADQSVRIVDKIKLELPLNSHTNVVDFLFR